MKTLLLILLLTTFSYSQIDDDFLCGPSYDVMPTIIGGLDSLIIHLIYPSEALKNGTTGKVYLNVDLDSIGNITHIKVIRGLGYGCDEEAIRLIKTAKFTPAYMPKIVGTDSAGKKIIRSVPYKCKISIPIIFKL